MTSKVTESHKVITGTMDELAPIIKTEAIKYDSSFSKETPQETKAVPIVATETRKVAYTTTTGSNVCQQ